LKYRELDCADYPGDQVRLLSIASRTSSAESHAKLLAHMEDVLAIVL